MGDFLWFYFLTYFKMKKTILTQRPFKIPTSWLTGEKVKYSLYILACSLSCVYVSFKKKLNGGDEKMDITWLDKVYWFKDTAGPQLCKAWAMMSQLQLARTKVKFKKTWELQMCCFCELYCGMNDIVDSNRADVTFYGNNGSHPVCFNFVWELQNVCLMSEGRKRWRWLHLPWSSYNNKRWSQIFIYGKSCGASWGRLSDVYYGLWKQSCVEDASEMAAVSELECISGQSAIKGNVLNLCNWELYLIMDIGFTSFKIHVNKW